MKKYTWIVALLIVLSVVFMGCPSGIPIPPEPEFEWVTVFELATDEGIQALTEGKLKIGKDLPDGADSPIKPLQEAGEGDNHVIITAVAGPEDQAIAIQFESVADWGAGIDLPHKEFGFRVGDKITITGEVLEIGATGSYVQANFKVGSEDSHNNKVTEVGEFEWEIELDADLLKEITGGSPAAIRIEGRKGGQKVILNNIVIEGERPTNIAALPAPVIALTADGKGIEWAAIEGADGYKVFADAGETPAATLPADATSANLYQIIKSKDTATTYSITLVAVGVTGSSKDSAPSNAVSFTREPDSLPAGIVSLGAMNGLSPAETQGGWGIKNDVVEAGKLPKYLLVSVGPGGDGLGGTKVIIQSENQGWTEKTVSGDWNYNGGWAAPAKVFIFDLSLFSEFTGIALTDSYINVGLRMGASNTKITGDRVTGGAIVFADTAGATATAALCIDANKITDATGDDFWFVDAADIEAAFSL